MSVHPNADRLLQRTVRWTTRLYARATTTSSSRCCPLRCWSQSTRPCHRSPDWTPLAACTLSYYVQTAPSLPHAWMVTLRSTYLTWWCVCLNLTADLICAQRTSVVTTRSEYARRLVPDRFRLPPRTHATNYLQTFARSPLFRLLNNTSRHFFSTLRTFINFLLA